MSIIAAPSETPSEPYYLSAGRVEAYFQNFEYLARAEKWQEIISQGAIAMEGARPQDEAKICAQLTSSAFYLGDYAKASFYASRCRALSEAFEDAALFVRSLYLESAVYRAQGSYLLAAQSAEEALLIYKAKGIDNKNLLGKVYFNWGAAHADDPEGDLRKAEDCYADALQCFGMAEAEEDLIRTQLRLGKVYLLQKNYDLSKKTIDEIRLISTSERLAMQTDYLEAQLKFAQNEIEDAIKIARSGLARAKALGATADAARLISLLQKVES